MTKMKKAQTGKDVPKGMVRSEMNPERMIPKSKSNYYNGEYSKMVESGRPKAKAPIKKAPKAKNGMLKRADGSYSKRGLWDNIRANKGSGKKPTAAMLKQEKKIKAKTK